MRREATVSQMGLDVHKHFSKATARDAAGRIVWRRRLEHGDRAKLREELRQWPRVPVVLEGTFGWGWISDELKAAGQDPHLASSRKVAGWREARGMAKSNRLDGDLLSELWSQPLVEKNGELVRWWEVWLAPPEVRDQREWLRYRMTLVRMQTGLKNRLHATLHRHGIIHEFSDLFGRKGWQFLEVLAAMDDATLPESGRSTLRGYLRLLKRIRKDIAQVTRELRRQVHRSPEGELWRSLPGISWVLAYTILAETGQIGRFKSKRQLSSYSLLAPIACDTGDEDDSPPLGRHVGHLGRRTLKWAFIEAAHSAIRKDPRLRALYDRRTDGGKRDRNRGCIAVARELCWMGFSCVSKQRRYTAQPPQNGGVPKATSSTSHEDSCEPLVRECTRPDCPLVEAAA